jgi:hypothetical protein
MTLPQFAAKASYHLPPFAAPGHRNLPFFVGICRHLTFNYSLHRYVVSGLFWLAMSETAQPKRGGRAFHSILEPHFDFIHQLRQRRKTWQEIAELLLSEKGIRVTLYAPYRFYRRRLHRRAKGQWETAENNSQSPPASSEVSACQSQKRSSPLPPPKNFQRPDRSQFNKDQFV